MQSKYEEAWNEAAKNELAFYLCQVGMKTVWFPSEVPRCQWKKIPGKNYEANPVWQEWTEAFQHCFIPFTSVTECAQGSRTMPRDFNEHLHTQTDNEQVFHSSSEMNRNTDSNSRCFFGRVIPVTRRANGIWNLGGDERVTIHTCTGMHMTERMIQY